MYVKVKMCGQRSVYLEQARYIRDGQFITGYQINKHGDSAMYKGGVIKHLIQIGDGVTVIPQKWNLKYAELEDQK